MSIENVLASVAVKDLAVAKAWYTKLLGQAGSKPMAEVVEWTLPNGGGLQVYALVERAGHGSFTLAVRNITEHIAKLNAMGVDPGSDVFATCENGDDCRPRWQSHSASRSGGSLIGEVTPPPSIEGNLGATASITRVDR